MVVSPSNSRLLLLDDKPYLMRGVAYSPTPIGIDPQDQSLDFFYEDYQAIYDRDLPLMKAAGINTLRVYVMEATVSHADFLDKCVLNNITVVGGFDLHGSAHDPTYPFNSDFGFTQVRLDLQRQVQAIKHPAVTMWYVGNEINLPSHGMICDTSGNTTCLYDGSTASMLNFLTKMDELCALVTAEGMLCATPLAEYQTPALYDNEECEVSDSNANCVGTQGYGQEGANAWFHIFENLRGSDGQKVIQNMAVNAVNLYATGGTLQNFFWSYRAKSGKPLAITEYGVDSYQTQTFAVSDNCVFPPCHVMAENQTSHALTVQTLTEHLERNAVTCLRNCDTNVVTGGIIMAWSDEWHKGHGPSGAPANGPWGTEWWYNEYEAPNGRCPDWSPDLQSPCGYAIPNSLDDFWNEEWFGLFSIKPSCSSSSSSSRRRLQLAGSDGDAPRQLAEATTTTYTDPDRTTARLAYYYLQAMWTKGSCTPQQVALGATEFNWTAYNETEDAYPSCGARMIHYRNLDWLPEGRRTDCDYQNYVRVIESACPPVPSHYSVLSDTSTSLADEAAANELPAAVSCDPTVTPLDLILGAWQCDNETTTDVMGVETLKYRMQRVWGTRVIMLDCKPWMMRGVSYSPVPWMHDPSYHEPYGDYFTDEYYDIVKRDLALFQEMGANTVRLYAWRLKTRHMRFLDLADELGLQVSSAFEMGTAEDTPLSTYQERALALSRLQRRLQVSKHRAITMWQVGNELNGAWQEFVCEDSYAEKFLHMPCIFADNATRLCEFIDDMCRVVHSEGGWLCSTPLAGVNPPSKYTWGYAPYSATGWIQVCEGKKPLPEETNPYAVQHVDFWSANLYPGKNFDGFNFSLYAGASDLPLLVSEYGIDAYNVNAMDPVKLAADPRDIGIEDGPMQSSWLMYLVEDLERHSSACEVGCESDESRVALGGSIMAWQDEWWKGRVIEAVAFDNRTDAMADDRGSLCPDPLATRHSACGYPSGAQPDTYVNEEWFGLFTIHRPQCQSGDIDQVRARDAWFRLKLIWKYGSCLTFRGFNETLAPYNASEWPECGPELIRLRAEIEGCFQALREWDNREAGCEDLRDETNCDWNCYNARAECDYWEEWATSSTCASWATFNWQGGDCEIQALIVDGRCPPLPEHMADLNQTMWYETSNWVDRPEQCESRFLVWFHKDGNGSRVIMLTLVALCLLVINARRIEKMVREWLPRGASGRAAPPFCCLAFGCCFGGPVGVLLAYLVYLCFDRLRRCCFRGRPGQLLADYHASQAGSEGSAATRSAPLDEATTSLTGPLQRITRPACPSGYLPADARRARNARVRALLMPIAEQLAGVFGLQKLQNDFFLGHGLEEVPSNLSNQVDHFVHLLSQRFDRMKGGGLDFAPALRLAVSQVHDALLETYFNWMRHIRLRARTTTRGSKVTVGSYTYKASDFHALNAKQPDAGAQWVCNAQLHRALLYLMIWGEAANLRHMPECLCYIFYCASNSLLLTHPNYANKGEENKADRPPTADSPGPVASPPSAEAAMAEENEFLTRIVRPIYLFLKHEILVRKDDPISQRVMYDDVNEAFWNRRLVHSLLPDVSDSQQRVITAYAHLRDSVLHTKDGGEKATYHNLKRYFVKTYAEKISWWHLFATYYRVFLFNTVGIHVMITIAVRQHFIERGNYLSSFFDWGSLWYYLSTVALTHATVMVLYQLASLWVSPRRRWWVAALKILGYLSLIVLFVVENFVCGVGWHQWGLAGEPPDTCGNFSSFHAYFTEPPGASGGGGGGGGTSTPSVPDVGGDIGSGDVSSGLPDGASLPPGTYPPLPPLFPPGSAPPLSDLTDLAGRRMDEEDDGGVRKAAGVFLSASLLESLGMYTTFEVVALVYCFWQLMLLFSLVGVAGHYSRFRSYVGSNIGVGSGSTKVAYSCFWVLVLVVKFSFEYLLVIEPMIGPSIALWTFSASPYGTEGPADFYCWDFNWVPGRSCSYESGGKGFGDAFPEFKIDEEHAAGYLDGLRTLRSYYYRIMLLLLRWSTPGLLCFADTAILYSFIASIFSFLLAHYRRVYHAFSWSATVRNLPVSVMQFNTKILAESGVSLIERSPEWYLEDGIQNEVPSLEACSTQWHSFAAAWNSIVSCLRTSDLLSNLERDELLFEPLRDPLVREAFGVDSYVLFPTMLTSPVFSKDIWQQRQSSFPSVVRTLLQARDCTWYLLVQLNLVGERDQPPDAGVRRKFLSTVTRLAELEKAEHATRRMGDSAPLLILLNAFRNFVVKLHDVVKELTADENAGRADISEVDAGPDGPAAKVVAELKKVITMLQASAEEGIDDGRSDSVRPEAESPGLRKHLAKVAAASKLASTRKAESQHEGRGGSIQAQRRGTIKDVLSGGAAKKQQKISARHRDRAFLTSALRALLVLDRERVAENLHRVCMQPEVLNSLYRALTCTNRGCEPDNGEAIRQLVYFANSLHNRRLKQPPPVPMMKSFTCFTPHYQEEVTFSMESLHSTTENNASLLTILKSLHPDEWANLTQRINLVERHGRRDVDEDGDIVAATDDLASVKDHHKHSDNVAVGRQRRLSTTNNPDIIPSKGGADRDQKRRGGGASTTTPLATAVLERVGRSESKASVESSEAASPRTPSPPKPMLGGEGGLGSRKRLLSDDEERYNREQSASVQQHLEQELLEQEVQRWASDRSQVLSRTVRGMMRYGEATEMLARLEGVPEEDVAEWVNAKFEYVVACQMYHRLKTSSNVDERDKAFYIDELRHTFPARMRVAYVEVDGQGSGATFSSVLLGVDEETGMDRVLFKVRLPGNPILGEGKPENQNHAMVFTRGEHVQTLDMNQDNYMGESYKMRNLLEYFKGRVRIVGFREHIFSETGGAVAHFAASNEFVFGTMVQRFLTWPLCVRFHYGHPDVWDKVWALSSGGLSKASRTLHVSEDIFGGLNVILRGGEVEYEEYIHCGKARDITFAASNSFEQKISGGNAFQAMSRDFHRAAKNFDLFRVLSMFHTGSGMFATSTLMFWALDWFVLALSVLALVGLETFNVDDGEGYFDLTGGGKTQVYTAEWFVQLGFVLIFPLFLEYWGTMGMLNAFKEIVRQLLGMKFLFTLFQERTRAYYLNQGLTLGSARYIATGRGYTMSSNFLMLYDRYARSHFYCGASLLFNCGIYFCFTSQGGTQGLANTWPVMLVTLSMWFSPWIFNPHSFQASTMMVYLEEFLTWLDDRDDSTPSGWQQWHSLHFRSQRNILRSRKVLLFVGQKFFPKLVVFTACTAGMRIDPLGDADTKLNYAMFRSWISLSCAIVYLILGMGYLKLAHLNFLRQIFGRNHLLHLGYLLGLRVLMLWIYVKVVWIFFDEYLNTSTDEDWRPSFGIPYHRNTWIVLTVGSNMHILLVQFLSSFPDPKERNSKGKKQGGPLSSALVGYCDAWYRELDLLLGQSIVLVLLVLSVLPIAFLQTRILFNSVYASALDTMAARRHLVLYVYSQLNLRGLLRLLRFVGKTTVELCGWFLGLFGVRDSATALLKRTPLWPKSKREVGYNVLFDTSSGRFVPTEDLSGRPGAIAPGPLSADFLARLAGPGSDLLELGLRAVEDLSMNELRACIKAAGMVAGDANSREQIERIARRALAYSSSQQGRRVSVDSLGEPSIKAAPEGAERVDSKSLAVDVPSAKKHSAVVPPPEADLLPEGWREAVDLSSGRTYFFNDKSKQTSWVRPLAPQALWVEAIDPNSGRTFFMNKETGVRTWTRPEGMPVASAAAAATKDANASTTAQSSELAAAALAAVNAPRHRQAGVNRGATRKKDTAARTMSFQKEKSTVGSSRTSTVGGSRCSMRRGSAQEGGAPPNIRDSMREPSSASMTRESSAGGRRTSFVGGDSQRRSQVARMSSANRGTDRDSGLEELSTTRRCRSSSLSNAGGGPGGAPNSRRSVINPRQQARADAVLLKIREQEAADGPRGLGGAGDDIGAALEGVGSNANDPLLGGGGGDDDDGTEGFNLKSEADGELGRTRSTLLNANQQANARRLSLSGAAPDGTSPMSRMSRIGLGGSRCSAVGGTSRSSFIGTRRGLGGQLVPFPKRSSQVEAPQPSLSSVGRQGSGRGLEEESVFEEDDEDDDDHDVVSKQKPEMADPSAVLARGSIRMPNMPDSSSGSRSSCIGGGNRASLVRLGSTGAINTGGGGETPRSGRRGSGDDVSVGTSSTQLPTPPPSPPDGQEKAPLLVGGEAEGDDDLAEVSSERSARLAALAVEALAEISSPRSPLRQSTDAAKYPTWKRAFGGAGAAAAADEGPVDLSTMQQPPAAAKSDSVAALSRIATEEDDAPPPPLAEPAVDSFLRKVSYGEDPAAFVGQGRNRCSSLESASNGSFSQDDEEDDLEQLDRGIPADIRDERNIALGMRQSQLRRVIGSLAYHIGGIFGFQFMHPHGADGAPTMSSVANQIEHITALLGSRMDTYPELTFMESLRASVASLHQKVFENFINWVNHVGLPSRVMQRGYISLGSYDVSIWEFQSSEEANSWLCNAQLQRLVLFFLTHGEAANVRHLPEALCFIFYGMANTLLLVDTTGYLEPAEEDFPLASHFNAATAQLDAPGYPELDFLSSVITPLYEFIKHEVLTRKDEDVHLRAMYDDITECFWQRPQIARMLPPAYGRHMDKEKGGQDLEAVALKAYAHFRELLLKASKKEGGAKLGLREYFGKTYYEKQGWAHCYHVFGRVFMWHQVGFHGLMCATFGDVSTWDATWKSINSIVITHAVFKIIRQLVDWHIGHPPRSAFSRVPSFRNGDKQSYTEHITIILGFALVPVCFMVESRWRPDGSAKVFDMIAVAYACLFIGSAFVHTKPGNRVRSLWRKRHLQHIGSPEQMKVPFDTWLIYTLFWCVVLTVKVLFGYYELVSPLKKPLEGLVEHPFPFIEVQYCELNFQLAQGPVTLDGWVSRIARIQNTEMCSDTCSDYHSDGNCDDGGAGSLYSYCAEGTDCSDCGTRPGSAEQWAKERFCADYGWCLSGCNVYEFLMRMLLVLARCSVPWLVWQFDTYIWFNVCSAVCSSLLAVRRKIGVIAEWKHLVKQYAEAVHHFNVKCLGTNNGDSAKASAAALQSGKPDWSVEARSAEWQCWGVAWNELVCSLRYNDQISNTERDELLFGFVTGTDVEDFFGVPEYVLFPTMLTSPVFTATVWQQGKRAYPSFERTMLQARDLLVWLCVKLGLIAMEQRQELMVVLTGLADIQSRMAKTERSGASEVLRLRSSVVALIEHLQAVQKAPLPLVGSSAEAELAEGIADQVHLLMQRVKGLYVDGVDKDTLAIPLDGITRECADMWRKLQDLVKPETLLENAASSALKNLHHPTAAAVLGALGRSMTTSNPGGEPANGEAKRQLLFFSNSLFNTTMTKPPPVSRMKSWSCFTPHYGEDITYSMDALRGKNQGDNVNLQTLLISLFPDEWENFCERIGVLTMVTQLPRSAHPAIQRWASDRAQVLSRTVRGMLRYADGLRVLARLEGVPEEEIEYIVASKFEYVVTCQIYGKLRAAKKGSEDCWKADGIDMLRQQFTRNLRIAYVDTSGSDGHTYSVLLGVDPVSGEDRVLFKVRLPGNPILGEGKPENQNQAIIFTRGEHLQTLDMNQDNYLGESYKMRNLLECFQGNVRIVGFREHIFSESGGAVANFAANNEFVFGTLVQRFLTWPLCVRFHYGHPDVWDKTWAFSNGGVSKASRTLHVSEDIFAGFNTVLRGGGVEYLEYIHCGKGRDMGFTAINGFEQKISAGNALQCTSRDLYRLGKYFDIFRLLSFYCSGSGFYMTTMFTIWAVYLFAVAQLVIALCGAEVFEFDWYAHERPDLAGSDGSSRRLFMEEGLRRLQDMTDPRDAAYQLNASVTSGFTPVSQIQPHELATAEKSSMGLANGTDGNEVVGSDKGMIYGSFTILQLGFALMIPYGMEVWVETSLSNAALKLATSILGLSWIFSLFAMQTKGFNFSNAITYGRASYVATGRGFQMDTLSVAELYSRYAQSHIYLAAEMTFYLLIFQSITVNEDMQQVVLTVWAAYLASIALALSPWIFNPGALTFPAVSAGMREYAKWINDIIEIKAAKGTWFKWHTDRLKMVREASTSTRLMVGILNVLMPKVVLLMACLAYLRGRSTRSFWLHFTLVVLAAVVCLALSFVNLALFYLCERVENSEQMFAHLYQKLPSWLKRNDRAAPKRDSAEADGGGPLRSKAAPASICSELYGLLCGFVRRSVWLLILYGRFCLVYLWYFVMVTAWEDFCWSKSCSQLVDSTTKCHIATGTWFSGVGIWWVYMLYSWAQPTTFADVMWDDRESQYTSQVHDVLLSCQRQTRTCHRTCVTFRPVIPGDPGPRGQDQYLCVETDEWAKCDANYTDGYVSSSLSEVEAGVGDGGGACTTHVATYHQVSRNDEVYDTCWPQMPDIYILAVCASAIMTVCVQWAGMVRTPKKDSPFAMPMRAARVWADHYYRMGDVLVGTVVIILLWVLTVLPLNYVQSVLLFKRNFQRVIARRTHKADLLDKMIS